MKVLIAFGNHPIKCPHNEISDQRDKHRMVSPAGVGKRRYETIKGSTNIVSYFSTMQSAPHFLALNVHHKCATSLPSPSHVM